MPTCQGRYAPPEAVALLLPQARTILKYALFYHGGRHLQKILNIAIVRRVIYTTNAIESLNSGFRRLNRSRNVFPDSKALLKALYLAADNITKKWTNTLRDWGQVYAELSVMYGERLS